MKARTALFSLLLVWLAGCSMLPRQTVLPGKTTSPKPSPTEPPSATSQRTPAVTPSAPETPAPPQVGGLRLWVPPEFDPDNKSAAGDLLAKRLNGFTARRADTQIEVRVKALDGPGGLLDALSSANAAAPRALPDLVLLPRASLEAAALKGLVFPFDDLTASLEEQDWFAYAQQLARVQDSLFGLPCAGDALVLLYRPAVVGTPPRDWSAALELAGPLVFPAADASARQTLALYLSQGGQVQDAEGRPSLDANALEDVLDFYQQGRLRGFLPDWVGDVANDSQAWEAYGERKADLMLSWFSRYLKELPADTAAAAMPTSRGTAFTWMDGWVWALPNPQAERHPRTVELAEYLTAGEFLAEWTSAAGYLPPRASALENWRDATLQNLANRLIQAGQISPPNDVLAALGSPLQQAVLEILRDQSAPREAAHEAAGKVGGGP